MMNAFDSIAQAVADNGCTRVFGVPGGGPNLDLIGAFNRRGIEFVLAHTETGAAIMAATFSVVTNTVSAVIVTRGPGAAAVVNGAASATLDRAPLLVITDCVPEANRATTGHQRFDQRAMMRSVTLRTARIGNDVTQEQIADLIATATGPLAGAVHIDLDAQSSTDIDEASHHPSNSHLVSATEMRERLTSCTSPVVICGSQAPSDCRDALERFGAPTLTTYQGAGPLPEGHPLLAGMFTNATPERELLSDADLVILIGFDDVEPLPGAWPMTGDVISIDTFPISHTFAPVSMTFIGHASDVLPERLNDPRDPTQHVAGVRSRLADASRPLGPIELVRSAAEVMPDEAVVTVDAGAHFLAVMPFWPITRRKQIFISNGLATMGYALPAAIGAACGDPTRPVIAFTGDGGIHMALSELETLQRFQLPVCVAVFNDSELTLIRLKQREEQGGEQAVAYGPTDFAAIAMSVGMTSSVVTKSEQLFPAFQHALQSGRPHLVDVRLDATEYDHILRVSRG
jgi:acetolactate synthase-1/2/3 large subunit